ncbi:aquaporin [Frondihabitans australicus]|uniref:MIP family channel protein n=1 Tax=Frondihabitans australicus TaxID=386892 RepID=A0A495IJC0_9MICO|nr:aquaporin [Frondihabitans australicus]RKR76084.1 MIP family channel protein [Frondihabitans australicus]
MATAHIVAPVPTEPPRARSTEPHAIDRLLAEVCGTFLLVFAVVGTATFSAVFPATAEGAVINPLGVGLVGVALALGLAVMVGAFAFGPISGGHFNPAVSLGLAVAGRFEWSRVPGYVAAQVIGACAGASTVFVLAAGSPGAFSLLAAALVEVVATGVLVTVILRATSARGAGPLAPIAIGFTLTAMLLVSIPIDNASLNPARSLATALYGGGDWLAQLWAFVVFPVVGAVAAGAIHRLLRR